MSKVSKILVAVILVSVFVGGTWLVFVDSSDEYPKLVVEKSEEPINNTIQYDNLSSSQQEAFQNALNSENNMTTLGKDIDAREFIENYGVIYQNETYSVNIISE